jgi:hypothetical protein
VLQIYLTVITPPFSPARTIKGSVLVLHFENLSEYPYVKQRKSPPSIHHTQESIKKWVKDKDSKLKTLGQNIGKTP